MRPWCLLVLLGCHDEGAPVDDTDPPVDTETSDTDPIETDVAPADTDPDSEPVPDDTAAGDTDTGRPVCFDPALPADWPTTWAEIVARAESSCVQTLRCEDGARTALQAWFQGVFYTGSDLRYDASGALFAGYEAWHSSSCDHWYGEVVPPCGAVVEAHVGSPGCARPSVSELPAPGAFGSTTPLSLVANGNYDPGTIGDTVCVGTATCTLGDRTLTLLWAESWGSGSVHAWEDGELVAASTASYYTVPAWVGEDLSACVGVTFTPSAACGVVQLAP